jgi:hypothetical protein
LRKLIATSVAVLALAGGSAFAASANPKTDEDGHQANDHGLCTAYYAGSENGQAHKHQAGPFVDLVARAGDRDGDGDRDADDVIKFCGEATPGNK